MSLFRNVPRETVTLDRPRALVFDLAAIERLQEAVGKGFGEVFADILRNRATIPPGIMAPMTWAALVDEDREGVTVDDLRGMIHIGIYSDLHFKLINLLTASLPEPKEDTGKPEGAEGKPKRRQKAGA